MGIFELDINAGARSGALRPSLHSEEMEEYEALLRQHVRRPQKSNVNNLDRPGFVGSLPADEHLQKLATGPVAPSPGMVKTDWKQAARQKVLEEARTAAVERELKVEQEAGSSADEGTYIRQFLAALVASCWSSFHSYGTPYNLSTAFIDYQWRSCFVAYRDTAL